MPDLFAQLIGPAFSGAIAGLVLVAGLRVEVRNLKESITGVASSVRRAHVRIDDHISQHNSIHGGHL